MSHTRRPAARSSPHARPDAPAKTASGGSFVHSPDMGSAWDPAGCSAVAGDLLVGRTSSRTSTAGPSSGSSGASLSGPSSKRSPRRQRKGAGCPPWRRPPAGHREPAFWGSGVVLFGWAPWSCGRPEVQPLRHVCVGAWGCFAQARRKPLPLLLRVPRGTGPLRDLPGNGIRPLLTAQLVGFPKTDGSR